MLYTSEYDGLQIVVYLQVVSIHTVQNYYLTYDFVFYAPSTILKYSNIHKIINLYPISKFIRVKVIPRIGDKETTLKQYLQ